MASWRSPSSRANEPSDEYAIRRSSREALRHDDADARSTTDLRSGPLSDPWPAAVAKHLAAPAARTCPHNCPPSCPEDRPCRCPLRVCGRLIGLPVFAAFLGLSVPRPLAIFDLKGSGDG